MGARKIVNYFQVLNVSEDAEKEVIIASYKALAKKYHPDSGKVNQKEAEAKMALINEAYEILSDDAKRLEYQVKLRRKADTYTDEHIKTSSSSDSRFMQDIDDEFTEEETIVGKIIGGIVSVCIVCSFIHFGLGGMSGIGKDILEAISELLYNFHLK